MKQFRSYSLLMICFLLALGTLQSPLHGFEKPYNSKGIIRRNAKNAILLIADGMGAPALTLARHVLVGRNNSLVVDRFPVVGRVIGSAQDAPVNDSAAAASAFATGYQGFLGKLSVDADGNSALTLFEEALKLGFRIGLVSDTRLTHATPGAFAGHVSKRGDEETVAVQMIKSNFNVLFSGGRSFFLPAELKGRQPKGLNLLNIAQAQGYKLVGTRLDMFDAVNKGYDHVLGLFSESFMSYSFDNPGSEEPTLGEMTSASLKLLESSDQRFLLMVEAGQIDPTLHEHDAYGLVSEIQVLEETVKILFEFVINHPDTLLVMVSDHATGGIYLNEEFDSQRFKLNAKSTIVLQKLLKNQPSDVSKLLKSTFPNLTFSNTEISLLEDLAAKNDEDLNKFLGSIVFSKLGVTFFDPRFDSRHKEIHGHTDEDLFVHSLGVRQTLFGGVMRNWEISRRLALALGIKFPL